MEQLYGRDSSNFMPTQFAKLVEMLDPFVLNARNHLGQGADDFDSIPIPAELMDIAHQAHVSPFHIKRWTSRLLSVDQGGKLIPNDTQRNVGLQIAYLGRFRETPAMKLEDAVAKRLDDHPLERWTLGAKHKDFPLLPGLTLDILGRTRTSEDWYQQVVADISHSDQAAAEFMRKLKYRQQKVVGHPLVDSYLNDFEDDMRLHIAEVLNSANAHSIFAINSGHEGVVTHGMQLGVSRSEYADVIDELKSYDDPKFNNEMVGKEHFFSRIIRQFILINQSLNSDSVVVLPVITGSYDVSKYAVLLKDAMVELNQSLDQHKPYRDTEARKKGDHHMSYIALDGRPKVLLRPFPTIEAGKVKAEARMALKLKDVSFRADYDLYRGQIAMDFGHTEVRDVLKYLKQIDGINRKNSILDIMKNHQTMEAFINSNGIGPSIMAPYGESGEQNGMNKLFSDSTKVAVMSSVVAGGGEDAAMRRSNGRFGYHMREHIDKPEYVQNGPVIMYAISKALTTSAV